MAGISKLLLNLTQHKISIKTHKIHKKCDKLHLDIKSNLFLPRHNPFQFKWQEENNIHIYELERVLNFFERNIWSQKCAKK